MPVDIGVSWLITLGEKVGAISTMGISNFTDIGVNWLITLGEKVGAISTMGISNFTKYSS